jgi:DNA repair/transcription protein MET18/MMS19
MEANISKNVNGGDLDQIEAEIKALLSIEQQSELIDNVPKLSNLILSVLDRVKDIYQVYPALMIVSDFLTKAPQKVPQLFLQRPDIISAILKNCSSPVLHVPAYNFKTRNVVFMIYQSFLLNREQLLSKVENPSLFISAVLGSIDEEKDPRNLLITYDILYFMLRQYATGIDNSNDKLIKPFIDEIFDKISCYFPINFVPPKNDKYQITPEILKDKLARCFLASPMLAQSAFPFVLDKMTATQIDTKKECLGLLQ